MNRPTILGLLILPLAAAAQSFEVEPYLQLVEQESVWVLWETNTSAPSVVEFGLSSELGSTAEGSAADVSGGGWVHEVQLPELTPNTRYYYRVTSGDAVSDVRHFVTAPERGTLEQFRLVAMSDMQHDGSNPDVFAQVVSDGILALFAERFDADLTDVVAMTLIPGDLVENGNQRDDWTDQFWPAIAPLAAQVPVYPVPGNHENNADAYFEYFRPPNNGTPPFEEHWWWLDYENVRIIGLDSNSLFANPVQLDWLAGVLDETCTAEHVDFVIAQLHHPFKSELWTPGELGFTGEVVRQMEAFSTDCGKPSAHLFGHTHGYSRGQSRDHQHLWVNVATAGGRIDYWDEFPQEDYPEFSVSEDEYGFVIFEVETGDDPALRLERISRGDTLEARDNETTDMVEVRRYNEHPRRPSLAAPEGDANPDCSFLVGSAFEDPDGDEVGGAHWQLSESCDDFSAPIRDEWIQHENRYRDEDLLGGDDPTDLEVLALPPDSSLCARVRYRDRALAWSRWSEPVAFRTGISAAGENLLANPGAEDELASWTVSQGIVEALLADECDGTRPYEGERYFIPGGLCDSTEYGEAYQEVSLGLEWVGRTMEYGGYLRDSSGSDVPAIWIEFRDDRGDPVSASARLERAESVWAAVRGTVEVPAGVASVRFYMSGTRQAGEDNDSYIDALWLRDVPPELACSIPGRPDPPVGDVGPDAEPDVGPEPVPDAGSDAPPDASADASADGDAPEPNTEASDAAEPSRDASGSRSRRRGCAVSQRTPPAGWWVVALLGVGRRRRQLPRRSVGLEWT